MKKSRTHTTRIKDTAAAHTKRPPLFASPVSAGFPAPGDDLVEARLDLDRLLVQNPAATFFVRATGDSMRDAHIATGDILVVDRSLEPHHGSIVVAAVMGELVVKRVVVKGAARYLASENEAYAPIRVDHHDDCVVWGVVRGVVRVLQPS